MPGVLKKTGEDFEQMKLEFKDLTYERMVHLWCVNNIPDSLLAEKCFGIRSSGRPVLTMVRTKIEVSPALVRGVSGLDNLARIVFPDNRGHRRVFVLIWTTIKYADDQFVPTFDFLCAEHGFSQRVLETVRAKMKKLGILKRISHFNPRHGNVGGWTFSNRFAGCLAKLANVSRSFRAPAGTSTSEQKDQDSVYYV